eukprot:scaffold2979_cov243-Pinguiococcus_pyrenoidosus.AAC.19
MEICAPAFTLSPTSLPRRRSGATGFTDGGSLGWLLGSNVGSSETALEGAPDGARLGKKVGSALGPTEGELDGSWDGSYEGSSDGRSDGAVVGGGVAWTISQQTGRALSPRKSFQNPPPVPMNSTKFSFGPPFGSRRLPLVELRRQFS